MRSGWRQALVLAVAVVLAVASVALAGADGSRLSRTADGTPSGPRPTEIQHKQ